MDGHSAFSLGNGNRRQGSIQTCASKDYVIGSDLWVNGLICAFEHVKHRNSMSPAMFGADSKHRNDFSDPEKLTEKCSMGSASAEIIKKNWIPMIGADETLQSSNHKANPGYARVSSDSCWVPIGWDRVSELVQMVQTDTNWDSQHKSLIDEESDFTVADVAAPYWERPAGPTWWCHVMAGHRNVDAWLSSAQWLHPAISTALRDESQLISEKMKHLLYEVPVRVAGGLLFELLGQSVGDPTHDEDDIPIVLRSWQAQNFLVSALHVKGSSLNINVLGITEVQELLFADGSKAPKCIHEVIAELACRLARWDDRLWRKYVFGAADEIELKFVNRRNHDDLNLLCVIFNQEIRRLATQVIRVKWSLHAREEIIFELLQHLRGNAARAMLERVKKDMREMLEEQEAVRGRLFTIQDVMQSTVRAWLQDRSLRVTHNLTVIGGCGLVLTIITGLFGINVDGIPGAQNTPYAFWLFSLLLFLLGVLLIGFGMVYFGLQNPVTEEKVQVRKLELQEIVSMFQHDAETHAKVREGVSRHHFPAGAISGHDCLLML